MVDKRERGEVYGFGPESPGKCVGALHHGCKPIPPPGKRFGADLSLAARQPQEGHPPGVEGHAAVAGDLQLALDAVVEAAALAFLEFAEAAQEVGEVAAGLDFQNAFAEAGMVTGWPETPVAVRAGRRLRRRS